MNKKIKNLILKRIFSKYKKIHINAIVLFGSRARGDFNKNSDYDVKVYINSKTKKKGISNFDFKNNIYIDFDDTKKYKELKRKGHPWIYCTFRDGIPIYQRDNWFNKNRSEILKLRPCKEIIAFYLKASLEMLIRLSREKLLCLDYEDGKTAANQLGFAIFMDNEIYPISPHTLKKELIILNKKYKRIAEIICYTQNVYYKGKRPKEDFYKNKIKVLRNFAIKYMKKNFPNELNEIRKHEKLKREIGL